MCPEHKVRDKGYSVSMVVDEKRETVESIQCHDCTASRGTCKHAIAFLMWVHRRSEEPSCTSVACYWQKSKLSKVGSAIKFISAKDLAKENNRVAKDTIPKGNLILDEFFEEAKKRKLECEILKHDPNCHVEESKMLSLHTLMLKYSSVGQDSEAFLACISSLCTGGLLQKIEQETREQHKSSLWHELRYARVTASKAFEVSRCKTEEGSLVASIMGAKLPDMPAMKRGRLLESKVRCVVQDILGKIIKPCGIFISAECPIIAASPDGICEDAIIEIKCPINEKTFINYVKDGEISKKYAAQMQVQMFASNIKRGYFCVADCNFEVNNLVDITLLEYDEDFLRNILNSSVQFWKKNIFPLLYRSTKHAHSVTSFPTIVSLKSTPSEN